MKTKTKCPTIDYIQIQLLVMQVMSPRVRSRTQIQAHRAILAMSTLGQHALCCRFAKGEPIYDGYSGGGSVSAFGLWDIIETPTPTGWNQLPGQFAVHAYSNRKDDGSKSFAVNFAFSNVFK